MNGEVGGCVGWDEWIEMVDKGKSEENWKEVWEGVAGSLLLENTIPALEG